MINYQSSVPLGKLPMTRHTYAGREPDAPWRQAADERIEKIRKGDLTVSVVDAAGKPIEGAAVKIAMRRHAFHFGTAVSARNIMGESPDEQTMRKHILELFNEVTLENDLKWPGWETEANRPITMQALKWIQDHGLRLHGHVLVWPGWKRLPADVPKLRDDKEKLAARVLDHIHDEGEALRGIPEEFDVINEPYTNHDLMDVLGKEAMLDWFQAAREALPETQLFINDFSILSGGGKDTKHQDHYYNTIRYLLDNGAPLQGIGLQSHFSGSLTPPERVLEILDRFAQFGAALHVTEYDVNTPDEELAGDFTRDFLTCIFSHPATKGFIMWGFWDGRHWKGNAPLFRKDWSLKPAGQAYMDLVLNKWWTNAEGKTDPSGRFLTRGFLGEYEVEISVGGKTKTVNATLGKGGAAVEAKMD
ncbi:MAG: endo-1,4-beta-xylanase [Candidatus Sumerlaeota bacterium]|nr:endo-1,4-beta-xylanase [Candidatus Sumerlaeota bacterium]